MTTKRSKVPQRFNAAPREVKRVDGWETSDGKVHDHPIKATAHQAELDLFRLVFHFIDVEEAMDGSEEDAKRAVRNLFKEYRDELAQLSRAAYMTPDEVGEAMDRHAGASGQGSSDFSFGKEDDDHGKSVLSPNQESEAKAILRHCYETAWKRSASLERPNELQLQQAFDKYWMFRTSDQLRHLLPPAKIEDLPVMQPEEAELSFAFTAGFVAAQQATGKSASTMFNEWMKSRGTL